MTSFFDRLRRLGQRPDADDNPLLTGPVNRNLLRLSIPMILAMMLVTGFGLVDMLYLGRYSHLAMASIAMAFPVSYLLYSLAGALGQAATSLCARLAGAGEKDQVRNLLWHMLLLTGAAVLILIPVGLFSVGPILRRMGADPVVTQGAITYTTIAYLAAPVSLLPMVGNALFRGEGDTIFPFKVMATALGLNAILDPLFIFGWGPIPEMGVAGAAVTTSVSFCVATVVVLREMIVGRRLVRFRKTAWSWQPSMIRDVVKVAAPALVANLSTPISAYLITDMLTDYGTEAIAAFGAGARLLGFVFLPTLGISMAMMVLVGQNHGAGQRDRVVQVTRSTLRFALTLMAVLALPVILMPARALSIFTDEPAVIAAGIDLARWVTIARPMLSVVNITAFWFQAQGNGLLGMLPNVTMRVFLEPLGVWLGLRLGSVTTGWYGLALADVAGGLLCGTLLFWRLRTYARG